METAKQEPKTIPELIDAFGGTAEFGRVIGKNQSTASEMKRSASIRLIYWRDIVKAAPGYGIEGVTIESIVGMHLASQRQKERAA